MTGGASALRTIEVSVGPEGVAIDNGATIMGVKHLLRHKSIVTVQ